MAENDPQPFQYRESDHEWRHGPEGYDNYESYRRWLRDEFDYRCAYCLFREAWVPTLSMTLDHFVAKVHDSSQAKVYENLRYACPSCNSRKSSKRLPCPLEALRAGAVEVLEDGTIVGKSLAARKLIKELGLDAPDYNQLRQDWLQIVALAKEHRADRHGPFAGLYQRLMGYPNDVPNLSRSKPPRNSRPAGVSKSAFARRQRRELPEIY